MTRDRDEYEKIYRLDMKDEWATLPMTKMEKAYFAIFVLSK